MASCVNTEVQAARPKNTRLEGYNMNIKLFSLILISVSLSALAQLLLKLGMSSAHVQQMLMHERLLQAIWVAASNIQVIAGLGIYALGAILWLLVLARVDVSLAYPFVGLGFILTMALGGLCCMNL
jgi:hypothetical protein